MKKILKSSQEIRDIYGMSNPGEEMGYDDNRSSTISVGPNEYAEQRRADGVQMPPGSSDAIQETL
ncbi:hypothetical protein LTR41_012223 [Exophiala xenobiotica]|nr:hypothetical protein LTR41_012223 [Exophiala xenobiotica]